VALAELRGIKIANHAIWMAVPKSLQEKARARNVSLSTYRSFRMPGWRGPYLLADASHVVRLIEAVPSPNNGACVCTGMYMMGDDPIDAVRWFGRKIFFVQIRDLRGRWPLSESVFPGSGEVDFPGLLETIVDSGYHGTVHVEHLGPVRSPGEDLETAALEYLRPLVEMASARRICGVKPSG
jgi:hydroxypyruvate isomerase